jgi:hypothetical protein
MKLKVSIIASLFIILFIFSAGCSEDTVATNPASSSVDLSVGFSKLGSNTSLLRSYVTDSLRVDSIIVVLQRIKFESHIDDAVADSTGKDSIDTDVDANYTFRGPFMVHVRDSMSVNFATHILPAGTYTGIKFKIHTVKGGEYCEDSDVRNHRPAAMNSDSLAGYSIAVWGSIKKNGAWVPFAFRSNIEVEYKIKGNFTIVGSTSTVNMALRFNTSDWFKDLSTGVLLDPTDTSSQNRNSINQAIKRSFDKGHSGKDGDDDGHPDD